MIKTSFALIAAAALAFCLAACSTDGGPEEEPGKTLWAKSTTLGSGASMYEAVLAGRDGKVYAASALHGTYDIAFGDGVVATGIGPAWNFLLVKYDASGKTLWARIAGSSLYSGFTSLAEDAAGNIYAAGYASSGAAIDFGNGVVLSLSSGLRRAVLVKYDADGNALWAKAAIGGDWSSFISVAVSRTTGSVYAAGAFATTASCEFAPGVSVAGKTSAENALLVKFRAEDGLPIWAKTTQTTGSATVYWETAISPEGDVYAAGSTGDVGSSQLPLLEKFDSGGTGLWTRSAGSTGSGSTIYYGLDIDETGNAYAAGELGNGATTFRLGATPAQTVIATGATERNLLLVKYDRDGKALWARTAEGAADKTSFTALRLSAAGHLYAGGGLLGLNSLSLGNGIVLNGPNATNSLVVKYDREGNPLWAKTALAGDDASYIRAVSPDAEGNLYAAGELSGTTTYDFGNGVAVKGTASGSNILLLKYRY